MGIPAPLTTEDWARVRYEYESTDRTIFDICAERGISDGTLRDRVRRWGWKRRRSGPVPREGPPPMVVPIIEINGLAAQNGAQGGGDDAGDDTCDDTCEDVEELRASLSRQIDALIEQERQERPRRYLAAWEEFAAQAAKPAAVRQFFSKQKSNRRIAKLGHRQSPR